jgi:hypothetical protein
MKVFDIKAPTPQGPAPHNHQAFLIGLQFHEAGIRTAAEIKDRDGTPVAVTCPMIVCYAFSAELYLKSLTSRPIRSHELKTLFSGLPRQARKIIEDLYKQRTGRGQSALNADLDTMSNAFADWRYVFEGDGGQQLHFHLLNAFVKSTFECVRLLKPYWEVSATREARFLADEEKPIMTIKNLGGGTFLAMVDGSGGTLNTPDA